MRSWRLAVLVPILAGGCVFCTGAGAQADARIGEASDGMADARIFNGFKCFHAGCNHCHGQDGLGSSFGPSLVDRLPDIATFQRIVRDGTGSGTSVMKGFAGNSNVEPYIDDIYAYLQARTSGALGRGRPIKQGQ